MSNQSLSIQMGCYEIGRFLAAFVEQIRDAYEICFPASVAPYQVAIVDIAGNGYANELHDTLENNGIDVILDDRDVRPGVKFNDMDLIGIPIRITVGKKISDGIVEVKMRKTGETKEIQSENIVSYIEQQLS